MAKPVKQVRTTKKAAGTLSAKAAPAAAAAKKGVAVKAAPRARAKAKRSFPNVAPGFGIKTPLKQKDRSRPAMACQRMPA